MFSLILSALLAAFSPNLSPSAGVDCGQLMFASSCTTPVAGSCTCNGDPGNCVGTGKIVIVAYARDETATPYELQESSIPCWKNRECNNSLGQQNGRCGGIFESTCYWGDWEYFDFQSNWTIIGLCP